MILVALGIVLFSLAVLPVLHIMDVWIVHNPRPAHPLHLLFVWLLGGTVLWALSPALSLVPFLSLAATIGGSSANLLYRLIAGPVPDYIPFPAGAYGNVADVLIIGGTAVFVSWVIWQLALGLKSNGPAILHSAKKNKGRFL